MPISYAEDRDYTCEACGTGGVADLWLLIDVAERPDLLERIKTKWLRALSCQKCSNIVQLPTGFLLIYRPHDELLMFVGQSTPEPHQTWSGPDLDAMYKLAERLADSVGPARVNSMLDSVLIVPPMLAHVLVDEQRVASLETMLRDLASFDWAEQRQLVSDHPEFTDVDALGYLDWKILGFRNLVDHESEEKTRDVRNLLGRVLEVGVEIAFAGTSRAMQMINGLKEEHPELSAVLRELVEGGVDIDNRDALRNTLSANAHWRSIFDEAMRSTRAALTEQAARTATDPLARMNACVLLAILAGLDPEGRPIDLFDHAYAAAVVLLGPGPQQAERASMSIRGLRSLLHGVVADAPVRRDILVYLALAYVLRDRPGDLDRADDSLRRAVGVVAPTREATTQILLARGRVLLAQRDTRGDEALHDAIAVYRDVLDNGAPDQRTTCDVNHKIACCYGYLSGGDRLANIRTGIDYARRSFDANENAVSKNSALMVTVGLELDLLGLDPTEADETLREHLRIGVQDAAQLGFNDSIWYFAERLGMVEAERGNWTEAASAYERAVAAVDRFFDELDTEGDRHQLLSEVGVLNAAAAYALAKAGRLVRAAEVLERGRARAMARAMRRGRAELTELEEVRPDLVTRFRDVSSRLSMLERHARDTDARMSGERFVAASKVSGYSTQTAYEYDAVIGEIRALPGFESFLLPADFSTLASRLPTDEIVTYVCATKHGSLALIVDNVNDVRVRAEFPKLTTKVITELIEDSGYGAGQLGDYHALSSSLADVLTVLGESLLAPLVARLVEMQAHRVVLIPCGHLGVFPLHAADGPAGRLMDLVDVSYAPSLEIYLVARDGLKELAAHPLALAGVGDPEPNPRPLTFARIEIAHVASIFSHMTGTTPTVLVGPEARTLALLAEVGTATHVHLACHGYFSPEVPLDSGLVMAGKDRLTLRDVMESHDFDAVRMVVMSACQTGMTAVDEMPEEVIGLPSGFLHAGVPGVVGALWSVDDVSTALLMRAFYECLQADASHTPAAAMRAAQRRIATMTYGEAQEFMDSDVTCRSDSTNVRSTSRALTPAPDAERECARDHPFADPYYWAAFTVNGC